jgi:hypothetical protein
MLKHWKWDCYYKSIIQKYVEEIGHSLFKIGYDVSNSLREA